MAITGPASFIPTINEFLAHWQQCNAALAPASPLLVRLREKNITVARAKLLEWRDGLQAQQNVLTAKSTDLQLARASIVEQKAVLLACFNQFTTRLDAFYQGTNFYQLRPVAPGIGYGQFAFSDPMGDAMTLWNKMNEGPAPAGVTLPLVLPNAKSHGEFSSLLAALQFAYAEEKAKDQDVALARGERNRIQKDAYEIMRVYRETVPDKMANFPVLLETLPRLTPLPGHTPAGVNASAVFVAPNQSKVVYDASTDAMLHSYQLRGTVGDDYNEDAVVIATHAPADPREFVVPFGLNQPGAKVALKVYVILITGNEAGSAAMFVERPVSIGLAA